MELLQIKELQPVKDGDNFTQEWTVADHLGGHKSIITITYSRDCEILNIAWRKGERRKQWLVWKNR